MRIGPWILPRTVPRKADKIISTYLSGEKEQEQNASLPFLRIVIGTFQEPVCEAVVAAQGSIRRENHKHIGQIPTSEVLERLKREALTRTRKRNASQTRASPRTPLLASLHPKP